MQLFIYVSLSSNPSGAYSIQSGGGWHSLAPGQSHTVTVRLTGQGQSPGTKTGELRILWYYQGSQFADDRTNLTGIIAHDPDLSGAGLNFGQTYLGETRDGTCWIQNDSEESLSLTIDSISIQGSDQNRFEILSGAGGGTLSPGQRRDIEVRYLADVVGAHDDAYILIEFTYDGLAYHGDSGANLSLSGETLPLPTAKLWLDDDLTTQGDSAGTMILSIDHTYPDEGGTYCDQSAEYNKMKPGDLTYVIISDFGGSKAGLLLKKRQRIMEEYRANGLPDDSREVLTETLNVMGQTWMEETTLNEDMLSELWGVISIRHHRFGVVAQETGYYIDVKAQVGSHISKHNDELAENACFRASNFLMSAMEHGVLEQLQIDVPAASTVKLFQIANSQGHKIFMANADNYSTIEPQLTGYSAQDFQDFQDKVNSGATLFLPAEGQLTSAGWEWQGKGYIEYSESESGAHVGMIIGGDYYGGYAVLDAFADAAQLVKNKTVKLWNDVTSIFDRKSKDPINMTTGAAISENTDLSMGGGEPLGLRLTRFYTSDSHYKKTVLGHGWNHNYNVYADVHSDGESGLGSRLPVDCAGLIAASVSTLDLMETDPQVREWTISSLIGKWAMDRLSYNAVSVYLRKMALTYIKLPDDTYNPPPGVTMELIKDGSLYRLDERFDETIRFNADNKISSWEDADGNTTTFNYSGGKLNTAQDAFGRTLTFTYNGDLLDTVTDSTGRSVSYEYDGSENLSGFRDPENKLWSYGYDAEHRLTTLTNPLSITTATNEYDTLGRVKTQTVPRQGGGNATYNFYFTDFRNIEEDPEGNQAIYYIDNNGRTIGEENALGHKSATEYDGQNHVTKTVDPRQNPTIYEYDGTYNLINVTDVLQNVTRYLYDGQFRKTDAYDPLDHRIHFDYDSEHHLTGTIVYPEDGKQIETNATYYTNGLTHTATDGRGTVTTMTYDAYGNVDTTQTGTQPAVDSDYDAIGLMQSLTDQVASTTTFDYDDRGLLETRTDPLLKSVNFTYYDDGRVNTITDRNSDEIGYTYTPAGKVNTVTYTPGGGSPSFQISYGYDVRDNLRTMNDSLGTTSYDYDGANRLTSVTDPHGFVIGYSYDEAGNLTTLTYPGNKTLLYTYDALNRLETVTIDWLGKTATYHYDTAGRLSEFDHFNGTWTSYGHDNADRLTNLQNRKSDASAIATYGFILDDNGNRQEISLEEPLLPVLSGMSVAYTYNEKKNRLLSDGLSAFSYDDEGHLSARDDIDYTFDAAHRLVGSTGSVPCHYFYDGNNNRLKAIRNGVTTKYIHDASGNFLAEADENNTIFRYYIYGKGLMAMVTASGELYCYHFDANANIIAMTDTGQNIVNAYAYTPFGLIGNELETIEQPFKFVGQFGVMTEPNAFYYMRARYYDPQAGRFISEDPMGFDGGHFNLFVYASNNPILFVDPYGLIKWRQVGLGVLQAADALGMAALAFGTTVGTAVLTGNPVLTGVVGIEMLPVLGAAVLEGPHAYHNIYEGLKDTNTTVEAVTTEPRPSTPKPTQATTPSVPVGKRF